MNVDPDGTVFWFFIAIAAAAIVGAAVNVASTFIGDVLTSIISGKWQFSSWETYLGSALGGAIGGVVSLFNPYVGTVIGSTISTFAGNAIGKLTGSNHKSWGEIFIDTTASFVISLLTLGMNKYLRIPGITKGSHSFQQVFKSSFTKMLKYNFSMSWKTIGKEIVYLLVSSFTTGLIISTILQSLYEYIKKLL